MANTSFYIASTSTHTFILELARKGSSKLIASMMPKSGREGDVLIPLVKVPLAIRRAARAHIFA